MRLLLLSLFFGLLARPGRAQDRIVLLRDTTRLGLSPERLKKDYPPAFAKVVGEQGVFARRGSAFRDSANANQQRFHNFIALNKRRLPVRGIMLETWEFVRPDGTYDRVFCSFSGVELTDEQELTLVQLVAEWYGQHPFPLKSATGFRWQNLTVMGALPQKRVVRRGPGILNTLEAAERTSRPDTVTMLAFNQLGLQSVPDVVYRFPKLEEIDLSNNNLHELPARLTADIRTLRRLSLLFNQIPNDSVFISPNKHLFALNLQGNKLTHIPRSIRRNRRLESLWLGHNHLQTLDIGTLRRLRRLNDLNLYSAGLTRLPKAIGRLRHVKVLDLYYNQLTELPRQLGRMKRLEQLAIAHNNLTTLPVSLANLRQLQNLYAHHNRLSQLPASFERLNELHILDIGYNWFTVAPTVLGKLNALEELDLNNNNLQEFPSTLNSLPNLKKVYLGSNPMFGREAMSSPYAREIEQLEARKTEVHY